jgi:hypothetical protein
VEPSTLDTWLTTDEPAPRNRAQWRVRALLASAGVVLLTAALAVGVVLTHPDQPSRTHSGTVVSVAVSADGRVQATAYYYNTVFITSQIEVTLRPAGALPLQGEVSMGCVDDPDATRTADLAFVAPNALLVRANSLERTVRFDTRTLAAQQPLDTCPSPFRSPQGN